MSLSLSQKVNCAYSELENLEKKVNSTPLTTPKFHLEVRRLKGECHRLHFDAIHTDEAIRTSRSKPVHMINDIERRIYLFRNEVGFVAGQLGRFSQWDKNPPSTTTIFSSPSNSPGSSNGSPAWSGTFSSAKSLLNKSLSNSQSSSGFGSQSSQGSSLGSQGQGYQTQAYPGHRGYSGGHQGYGSQGGFAGMFHPHNMTRMFYH